MSYDSSKQFEPQSVFAWGYVDNEVETKLNDKYSPYLRNARLDWSAIINRPWHELLDTLASLPALEHPEWIWAYEYNLYNQAYLTWWTSPTTTIWIWNSVRHNWEFTITINWQARIIVWNSHSMEFVTTMNEVATKIQWWLNIYFPIATVDWNWTQFIFNTNDTTKDSSISVTTWTSIVWIDISWEQNTVWYLHDFLDCDSWHWVITNRTLDSLNSVLLVHLDIDSTHQLSVTTEAWVTTTIDTSSDLTSWSRMSFLNVWDEIYCLNGRDEFWKLFWDTYTTPTTWLTDFTPSFWVSFNGSHFVSWWSVNSNIVYKSVWDDYDDFTWTWSDLFTFEEQITWLAVNAQALFYFTKNTVSMTGKTDIQDIWWNINYTTRPLTVKEWAINHASIVTQWNNVFYISPSLKILRIAQWQNIDWYEVFELSERRYTWISKLMVSLDSNQDDCFGYYLPKDNLIKWFFRTEWATYNDICIIYDTEKDAFLIDNNKEFYGWTSLNWINYTISTIDSKLFKDETGVNDESTAIPFEYHTKDFDLWAPIVKKELWEANTYTAINQKAELSQVIEVDWIVIDTKVIDSDNVPASDELNSVDLIRTKWDLQTKGKKIKLKYTNETVWGLVRLEDLNMRIETLPSIQRNLTE